MTKNQPNLILNHASKLLDKGYRYDKRGFDEYRDLEVQNGVSPNAEGSARVRIGNTDVMAGIKMSIESPFPDTPDKGSIAVNVELLPLSNPEFEPGPPGIQAVELARVVDRGLRESGSIDMHQLCIEEGEKVWLAFIDICTINDEGNLFDAASLAALAALKDTKLPHHEGGKIDYKHKSDEGLPLNDEPIEVTVLKIGGNYIVDPSPEEEGVLDSRLTVAFTKDGHICALQKGGDKAISEDDVDAMVELAAKKSEQLRSYI